MNPLNGDIHYGDAEIFDRIGKMIGQELVPIPEEVEKEVIAMNTCQKLNWAKQERKRKLRLQQIGRVKK